MDVINEQHKIVENNVFIVYKRRWVVLILFFIHASFTTFHWIQYSSITTIIVKYYNVDSTTVDWTSMIFMVTYVVLFVQGGYFMDKRGLRISMIIGGTMNFAACVIKILSVSPDRFWVAFIGQTLASFTTVFVLSMPVKIAAIWFGPDQVSSACSVGAFSSQLGPAIGVLVVPFAIQMHDNIDEIGYDMRILNYILTGVAAILLISILFYFPDKPPTSPSQAQKQIEETGGNTIPFFTSLKSIITNFPLMLFTACFGIAGGVINTMSTLLNQVIVMNHPGSEKDVGIIGIIIFLAGTVAVIFYGRIMDKTRKYKEAMLSINIGCFITYIAFSVLLHYDLKYLYINSAFQGFFMSSFMSVGMEFAAELSYPEPEATVGAFITSSTQLLTIVFTPIYSKLLYTFNDYIANGFICAVVLLGVIIMFCVKNDLKRQNALNCNKTENVFNDPSEVYNISTENSTIAKSSSGYETYHTFDLNM